MSETNENFGAAIGGMMSAPVVDFTTTAVEPAPAAVPEPVAIVQPIDPVTSCEHISVYVKESNVVSTDAKSDEVIVDVMFSVSEYCQETGASKTGYVKKRLALSKCKLLADMIHVDMMTPVAVVEEKKEEVHKDAITTKRMRELAGIPHPKNWI